jgi:hypothetical protein
MGATRKRTHAKRVNLTQLVGAPQMNELIRIRRRKIFGKCGRIRTANGIKVTKSSRFSHPLVTRVTGNLQPSPNLERRCSGDRSRPVVGPL